MNHTYTTHTPDDFDHIPVASCAPCETWIVAINSRWMAAHSVVKEGENAAAAYERALDYYQRHSEPEALPVLAMTFDQLMDWNHKRMAEKPEAKAQAITEHRFHEMLNVLPPIHWHMGGEFEHFKMCEFDSGSWTTQYARYGDRYAAKLVDVRNRETWITAEEVDAANAAQEATQ